MNFKHLLIVLFFSFYNVLISQEKNVFLNRDYWKKNPTIELINKDISKKNDITELNKYGFDPVTWAILEKASNKTIKYLITKEGNDINKITHDGRTYIFWAAYKNNVELMKYLVEKGAKMDIIDEHGYSLMNFAATTGQTNLTIYEICLEKGAKLNEQKNNDGANPILLLAPFIKDFKTLEFFTNKGLNIYDVDNNGNNLFTYAAKGGNYLIMNYALTKKLDPNVNDGMAMIFASKGTRKFKNDISVYKYLDSVGVSFDGKTKSNQGLLHFEAKRRKDTTLINYLIAQNLDLNSMDDDGNTPLINSIKYNSSFMIEYFITKSKTENFIDRNGNTLFHHAIDRSDIDIFKILNSTKNDINHKNKDGNTVLHLAAMKEKNDQLLKYLIENGAKIDILTLFDETAYDLAKENELLIKAKVNLDFLKINK